MTDAKQKDARRQTPDAKGLGRGERARHPGQTEEAKGHLGHFGLYRQAAGETGEHSLHMLQLRDYRGNSLFVGHPQERCDKQVRLQFARGSQSDIDETSELSIAEPATSFGDIRSDRHRRPPTLRNESKSLRGRKLFCDLVDAMDNNPTSLPHFEFPKVLHPPLVPEKGLSRNVPDTPCAGVWRLASSVSYPSLHAKLSATARAVGVRRLTSGVSYPSVHAKLSATARAFGVWRLASGVSSYDPLANPS